MYDAKKVVPGLVIFLLLITIPMWYTLAAGKAASVPEPKIITTEKECIEPAQYMKDNHMDLLDTWRWSVAREGNRTYTASDGKQWEISLRGTCMDCHSNKEEFCDQCHNYVGVKPNCWDCHVPPVEVPVSPEEVSK